ncbi:hypothetical protein FZEAL_8094 [Fusarium zealandicum]|uniref:Uncharacterized protein n=1 Tax=Fusarium zealandicum TaxID=1053134 RepID=A0A8H4XH58_9HYPO|nr:hypothetical protein FZEAL_8094 [Fusarium zealandicum]
MRRQVSLTSTCASCSPLTLQIICGQSYAHLAQAGSRVTYGGQCKRAIQDHIIRQRLTPLTWRTNLNKLLKAMYLTQHGSHLCQLMRSKVEVCVKSRIKEMVEGGLIKETTRGGQSEYVWRRDADNFLGVDGWWKDWSISVSKELKRQRAKAKFNSIMAMCLLTGGT